jgi:hypothetical protein
LAWIQINHKSTLVSISLQPAQQWLWCWLALVLSIVGMGLMMLLVVRLSAMLFLCADSLASEGTQVGP